jgi:hypothetical protein
MIGRMQAHGVTRIVVETDKQRPEALAAYMAIGFQATHNVLVYKYAVGE